MDKSFMSSSMTTEVRTELALYLSPPECTDKPGTPQLKPTTLESVAMTR